MTLEGRVADVSTPRRRIEYTDGSDTSSVTASYVLLRNLGSFSKASPTSTVLLTWNTHVDAMGEPGTFCDFQLRVDGKPDSEKDGGGGRAVVYVPPGSTGGSSPVTVATLFGRLGGGSHTPASGCAGRRASAWRTTATSRATSSWKRARGPSEAGPRGGPTAAPGRPRIAR